MKSIYLITVLLLFYNILYSQTWQKLDNLNNNNVLSIAQDDNNIYLGTESGSFYISTDKGNNWVLSNSNLIDSFYYSKAITIFNNKVYVGTSIGIFVATDSGKSWNNINNELTLINNIFVFRNNIYSYCSNNKLYFSTNEGINWSEILSIYSTYGTIDSFPKYSYCCSSNNDTLFCGMYWSGLYLSVDSAKSWIFNKLITESQIIDIFVSKNKLYFINMDAGILELYISTDYGINWKYRECLNSQFKITDYNNTIIIATHYGGIYYSKDLGDNWTSLNYGLPNLYIYSMALINNTLYCGPQNSGIYKLDINFLDVKDSPEKQKQTIVCPNPASDILTINNYTNEYNSKIEIYNIYGIKVYELPFSDKIDISRLSLGVYYLRIKDKIEKFIKI
jgi:hypothetical protein